MPRHLIRKLEHFTKLAPEDVQALEEAAGVRRRQFGAREEIIAEGENPDHVSLILDGWACRYKHLVDGRRQVISFFLPGDLCDPHVFILREMDHSIGTITPVLLAEIPRETVADLTGRHPRITQALWWEMLVTSAVQREWIVNLGQRSAIERLGHLLCELFVRLQTVGLTSGSSCHLPLTQLDLADAMGLSNVHVNRTLQELRAAGLIDLRGKTLCIPDLDALMRASLFNPNYLHLGHEGAHLDAD
ncbi:Crp/Fnr family transcriptional regulator [Methylobacterium sp. A54F]